MPIELSEIRESSSKIYTIKVFHMAGEFQCGEKKKTSQELQTVRANWFLVKQFCVPSLASCWSKAMINGTAGRKHLLSSKQVQVPNNLSNWANDIRSPRWHKKAKIEAATFLKRHNEQKRSTYFHPLCHQLFNCTAPEWNVALHHL